MSAVQSLSPSSLRGSSPGFRLPQTLPLVLLTTVCTYLLELEHQLNFPKPEVILLGELKELLFNPEPDIKLSKRTKNENKSLSEQLKKLNPAIFMLICSPRWLANKLAFVQSPMLSNAQQKFLSNHSIHEADFNLKFFTWSVTEF
jgi:hypothetical protein